MMKKTVLGSLVVLGLTSLSAQELSCSQIVSMNETEIKSYVNQLKNTLDVKSIDKDNIKNESVYIDKVYKITAQKNRCLLLREASKKLVSDIKRVKALALLSKDKRLTYDEKNIYNNALAKSRQHASSYSNASLVSQEVCSYPLLYLSAEKTANGTLFVYEKRLVGNDIKTFSKDMALNNFALACGLNRATKNNYLKHLNKKRLGLPLLKNPHDVYHPDFDKASEKEDLLEEFSYTVIKNFIARAYIKGTKFPCTKGMNVEFQGYNGNEAFFKYGGIQYRAGKYSWDKSTQRLKGGE